MVAGRLNLPGSHGPLLASWTKAGQAARARGLGGKELGEAPLLARGLPLGIAHAVVRSVVQAR